jgi:hypothetical protein
VLAKCRQSAEQETAATEPFRRSAAEREIAWFNQELSTLASGKTRANGEYPSRSIEDAYKAEGSILGFIFDPVDGATFPAKGLPAKVAGVIVTHEPDPDDSPDERTSEPQYFTLETEMLAPSATAARQAVNELPIPTTINLDIESLNRHERQFIIDHCHLLWATPCRVTVIGHFDEIVGRRPRAAGLKYVYRGRSGRHRAADLEHREARLGPLDAIIDGKIKASRAAAGNVACWPKPV